MPASFTKEQLIYWWRAQAIGYLMRFNTMTSREIVSLRKRLHGPHLDLGGAINLNIRAGDKWSEALLMSAHMFVDKALELINAQPLAYSRTLFVTSDSLNTLLSAKAYAEQQGLHVIYSDVPRMPHGNNEREMVTWWNRSVTLAVLMELSLTSECDAWIGSRSSNWNRLIDLRRCVHTHKCNQIFVEVDHLLEGHYDRRPLGFM
jgi:hypothetical protein